MEKVNICMIAYNQEAYIAQAIESVLSQKTNFGFKLVIGDDCSQDKTRIIIKKYKQKYPRKIHLVLNNTNKGIMSNWLKTISFCQGQYIAALDGDDYWSNKNKLQIQADFLDKHPNFSLCFHPAEAFYQDQPSRTYIIPSKTNDFSYLNLLKNNFIATCTVMYRNGLINQIPDQFLSLRVNDWPYHILYASQGEIGFVNKIMSRYRIHKQSYLSSHSIINNYIDNINIYNVVDTYLKYRYHSIFKPLIVKQYCIITQEYLKKHQYLSAKKNLKRAYQLLGPIKALTNKDWLKIFIKSKLVPCPV